MTTTIVKPTWSVDGWTGNTIDDAGTHWFARRDSGWFGPVGVRSSSTDRPAGDGVHSGTNRRASRVITLEGFCSSLTAQLADDALDQFNALLGDGELHELVVEENHRVLTAMVRLADGTNVERITPRRSDWQLVLVAPDPRKYSPTLHIAPTGLSTVAPGGVLWSGPTGSTGTQWNGPAGVTGTEWQSGVGGSGLVVASNAGTAYAPLEITFQATSEDLVNPSVTDIATGRVIRYGATVPAGSALVIDTSTGLVLLDGINRGPLLTSADFFSIAPKDSLILLFQATGSAPNASMTVRWRDAYI